MQCHGIPLFSRFVLVYLMRSNSTKMIRYVLYVFPISHLCNVLQPQRQTMSSRCFMLSRAYYLVISLIFGMIYIAVLSNLPHTRELVLTKLHDTSEPGEFMFSGSITLNFTFKHLKHLLKHVSFSKTGTFRHHFHHLLLLPFPPADHSR